MPTSHDHTTHETAGPPTSKASREQARAEADARYFAERDAAWAAVEAKTARLKAMRLAKEAEVAAIPPEPAPRAGRIRRH